MAKRTSRLSSGYRVIGRTRDGVDILEPKTKPTHFTRKEIREAIRSVLREEGEARGSTGSGRAVPSVRTG